MNMNHHNTLSVLAKALLSAGIFGGLALPAVQAASYRTDLHDFLEEIGRLFSTRIEMTTIS